MAASTARCEAMCAAVAAADQRSEAAVAATARAQAEADALRRRLDLAETKLRSLASGRTAAATQPVVVTAERVAPVTTQSRLASDGDVTVVTVAAPTTEKENHSHVTDATTAAVALDGGSKSTLDKGTPGRSNTKSSNGGAAPTRSAKKRLSLARRARVRLGATAVSPATKQGRHARKPGTKKSPLSGRSLPLAGSGATRQRAQRPSTCRDRVPVAVTSAAAARPASARVGRKSVGRMSPATARVAHSATARRRSKTTPRSDSVKPKWV